MSVTYSLTVINNSQLTRPTFAVFATLPVGSSYGTLDLAWLTQPINEGNQYMFTWDITWGFMWSAQGTKAGYQWNGTGKRSASPNSQTQCAVDFGYNGDFYFSDATRDPDGQTLWITDLPTIPLPKDKPCSVGVTLNGNPACVTNAGPNLGQTFTLHPTYYIDAGNYVQGQMVDGSSVTAYQELEYKGTNRGLTAILQPDNTWDVQDSQTVHFAKLLKELAAK